MRWSGGLTSGRMWLDWGQEEIYCPDRFEPE